MIETDVQRLVLVRHESPEIAVVTLNRPRAMNAFSRALRVAFRQTMTDLGQDGHTRAVILTGAGKAFSAGYDLKELARDGVAQADAADNIEDSLKLFAGPVIAAVNGPAVTGAFALALACDIVIASDKAEFIETHGAVGVVPGATMTQKLRHLVGLHRAKQISLTAMPLSARQACEWGLINEVAEPGALYSRALQIARRIAALDPEVCRALIAVFDDGYDLTEERASAMAESRERLGNTAPENVDLSSAAGARHYKPRSVRQNRSG